MNGDNQNSNRAIEASLVVICGALTLMLYLANDYKLVILNMFYLPVVLAAFYLGRQRACVLAFSCVLLGTIVAVCDLESFATSSELTIGLSLTIWAGIMGLNSLFVGTLSDERTKKISELKDAYLGVVEVLAQYLKSANPNMNDMSKRVAEISQDVGRRMRLSQLEIDDIRVAALLQDIDNIEITATVIHRAVDDLQISREGATKTFHGGDLVQSLGAVLSSALPLILSRTDGIDVSFGDEMDRSDEQIGAAIIRASRQFVALTNRLEQPLDAKGAIAEMEVELDGGYHPGVLSLLEQISQEPRKAVLNRDEYADRLLSESL